MNVFPCSHFRHIGTRPLYEYNDEAVNITFTLNECDQYIRRPFKLRDAGMQAPGFIARRAGVGSSRAEWYSHLRSLHEW